MSIPGGDTGYTAHAYFFTPHGEADAPPSARPDGIVPSGKFCPMAAARYQNLFLLFAFRPY